MNVGFLNDDAVRASRRFRSLHQPPEHPWVLANVSDAEGARLIESLGAKAISTTSAGIAWVLGHPNSRKLPIRLLARAVRQIVESVQLPVTLDAETGYSDQPAQAARRLRPILETGIAGINIEHGADNAAWLAAKVFAIRNCAEKMNLDLFINARTDVHLRAENDSQARVDETLTRASMLEAAGADGLFVPGLSDPIQIRQITHGTHLSVNVLASPELPRLIELERLNVRRLSAGNALSHLIVEHLTHVLERSHGGDFFLSHNDHVMYAQLQTLFAVIH